MTDLELITAWKAGDQRAATVLVDRHSRVLLMVAGKFGVREELEELVQDTFVRGFNSLDTFRGDRAALRSWLIVIMRRLIIDRGRAARRADSLIPLDVIAETEPISNFDTLDAMIGAETERRLFACIPPADLRMVRMRLAGHRWRKIAAAVGGNEASLKVRFHRMRATLREVTL